jgi:hypothetical protein
MPNLSFWGSVWLGEKPKNQKKTKKTQKNQCQFIIFQKPKTKKTQKNQKIPKKTKKTQKKTKKPMPNLRFKGSVWFFWDCYPPCIGLKCGENGLRP